MGFPWLRLSLQPKGFRHHADHNRYHSASRARIIAGLFGFLILTQSRDVPDRYGALNRFETMPSRPKRHACTKSKAPSSVVWSLRTMPMRRGHLGDLSMKPIGRWRRL
jgi:hypothetical protein